MFHQCSIVREIESELGLIELKGYLFAFHICHMSFQHHGAILYTLVLENNTYLIIVI